MKKIGIFGGTFNPIHVGHLKMASAARKEYKLSVIYFIPCGVPPHKQKKDLLPANIRYEMIQKTIQGKKYFKVLDIEIKSKKPNYTVDTIKKLRRKFNSVEDGHSHPLLYFLIGQDEFEKLHTWNKANELSKLVTFLILPRITKKTTSRSTLYIPHLKGLKWFLVHTRPINISSTEIRKSFKKLEQNSK